MRKVRIGEDNDLSVLIQGERGSGRRFLAREIHTRSPRRRQPFVAHDCRRDGSFEIGRVLYGQVRELAPGHFVRYLGLLEEVGDGTLYLEGIESLPQEVQHQLAKVLEGRSFSPIGSGREVSFRGRLIAACGEKGPDTVETSTLEGDLYGHLSDGICLKLVKRDQG